VLDLLKQQLSFWLDTKGIKAGNIGTLDGSNMASGVSKMIDEADTTDLRKEQTETFRNSEEDLWNLILKNMHPVWVQNGVIDSMALFTPSAEVDVHYVEPVPIYGRGQLVRDLRDEYSSGFISRRMAVKKLNPQLDEMAVDEWIEEIDTENTVDIEETAQPVIEEKDDDGEDG